jgi:hypothetical protein
MTIRTMNVPVVVVVIEALELLAEDMEEKADMGSAGGDADYSLARTAVFRRRAAVLRANSERLRALLAETLAQELSA